MIIMPMLSEANRKQRHVAQWAQVMPATQRENLRSDCNFCEENKHSWIINGRTAGLTRTGAIYCCSNCLYLALSALRWR